MEKLTEVLAPYFSMGGYAVYIWPSYGIAALIILAMTLFSLSSLRKTQKTLLHLQKDASRDEA